MHVHLRERGAGHFGGYSNDESGHVHKSKPKVAVITPRKTAQHSVKVLEDAVEAQGLSSPAAPQQVLDKTEQSERDSDVAHSKLHNSSVNQVGYQPSSEEDEILTAARELMGMVKSRVSTENTYDGATITAATVMVDMANWVPTENTNDDKIITAGRALMEVVGSWVPAENKYDGGTVAAARVMVELASRDPSQKGDDDDDDEADDK